MYEAHFGFRHAPFGLTPDTRFFFSKASHQEALNTLLFALRSGEGFLKVTGEIGLGKTQLCRQLLKGLVCFNSSWSRSKAASISEGWRQVW